MYIKFESEYKLDKFNRETKAIYRISVHLDEIVEKIKNGYYIQYEYVGISEKKLEFQGCWKRFSKVNYDTTIIYDIKNNHLINLSNLNELYEISQEAMDGEERKELEKHINDVELLLEELEEEEEWTQKNILNLG